MISPKLQSFALERGYPVMGDAIRCTRFPQPVGFAANTAGVHSVTVAIDPGTWTTEIQKALKKELKQLGTLQYDRNKCIVMLLIKTPMSAEKFRDRLEMAADALADALFHHGVQYRESCIFCGRAGCDDFADDGLAVAPAHASCKTETAQRLINQIAQNEENGNYVLAIICALIGGLVGCLPTLLTIYFTSVYLSPLFALIPLGAYYGYRLARGIMNRAIPFIICALSFVDTLLLMFFALYLVLKKERPGMSLDVFYVMYLDVVLLESLKPLLFCIIGIAIAWRQISQSNQNLKRRAQALAQSSASPGGNSDLLP